MTALTWAARIGTVSDDPSGVPSVSVTTRVTLWMPSCPVLALSSTLVRPPAGMSTVDGPEIVICSSETALMPTVTGWSSSLTRVAANRPLALESVTRSGATIRTEASWLSIHLRERRTEPRAASCRPRLE